MKVTMKSVSAFAALCTIHSPRMAMSTNSSGTNHKVTVGKDGPGFVPSHVSAKSGDTITFVFYKDGHTLTQTHFDNPCAGMNPPTASFCTTTSGITKNETAGYPTGSTDYPTVGSGSPNNSYPTDGLKDPTASTSSYPTDGPKVPPASTPTSSYPTDASSSQTNFTDPTKTAAPTGLQSSPTTSNPQCICPPVTQPSDYPSGPDPSPPKEKTCDGKCIEIAGTCQISTDCKAQSESPSNSKCKMEDGKCKRCGESARKMKKKRSYEYNSLGYFANKLFKRQTPGDDTKVSDTAQVDTTELHIAPTSQRANAYSEQSLQSTDSASQPSDKTITAGLDSGFVKVSGSEKTTGNSWTVKITADDKPLWFMCATPKHCTSGMVFAVNAPDTGDKTFDKFLQAATSSTCPTAYPSKTNLQGDGCTAAAPPCGGENKNDTSNAPPTAKPELTDPSKAPDTNTTTPAQNPTPPSTPSPSPPSPTKTPTGEEKPSSKGHAYIANRISLITYVVILFGSFIISEASI